MIDWNLFREAFKGHSIPSGVMEMKHTEFMQLTQGNKTLKEYLHAFNHLSRYAPEFVSTESKKIASFKRGLGAKLLKTMGRTKCATFNEFINDALTQENYNTVYTAIKTRKRAFEVGSGASQSKATVAARPQYRAPTPNQQYRPLAKKNQVRKGYSIALPRGNTVSNYAKTPPANHPCWNYNQTGHWQTNCPYPPKKGNQGNVRQGRVHYTTLEAIPAGEVVTAGKFLVNQHDALVLFDSGASHSFVSSEFVSKHSIKAITLDKGSIVLVLREMIFPPIKWFWGQLWK